MFRTQANGVEIYFNWPSKTARVVADQAVRYRIKLRDNIGRTLLGVMALIIVLYKGHSITIGFLMLFVLAIWFVERRLYLATLQQVPLHVTPAQVDKAYLKDFGVIDGVLVTGAGVLFTLGLVYTVFTMDVPLFVFIPLIVAFLIITYVGVRILAGAKR